MIIINFKYNKMNSVDILSSWKYLTEKDSLFFRREEDLLNVFNQTVQYHQLDDNFNFIQPLGSINEQFGLIKKSINSNEEISSILYNLNDDYMLNNSIESVEATVDNLESSEYQNENLIYDNRLQGDMKNSKNDDSRDTEHISQQSWNITFNVNLTPIAEWDSSNLSSVTIHPESNLFDMDKELQTGKRSKRVKIFSRRKDVIIKTLLRKWRKFFLKDFNARTNYLRTAKRKYGSYAYKNLLENYLNKIFEGRCTESLLIFMAAFMYQQDIEDSINLFVSEKYSIEKITKLLNQIHEILYKYSHQKFHEFSQNRDFRHVFMKFYEIGSEDCSKDIEYAAGIEIIIDQLH